MNQPQQQQAPPRPTCKVVTKPGQRGARIHPRGCRVRNRIVNGTMRKVSKATGQIKPVKTKIIEQGRNYYITVQRAGGRSTQSSRFLYDTGASHTSMSHTVAKRLGILTQAGRLRAPLSYGEDKRTRIADGSVLVVKSVRDVPLILQMTQEVVRGTVILMPGNASSLYGVSHIRNTRSLKVKFR